MGDRRELTPTTAVAPSLPRWECPLTSREEERRSAGAKLQKGDSAAEVCLSNVAKADPAAEMAPSNVEGPRLLRGGAPPARAESGSPCGLVV